MKIVVPLKDVPASESIHTYIDRKYNVLERFRDMPFDKSNVNPIMRFNVEGFDHIQILDAVNEVIAEHGRFGFLSHFKDSNGQGARSSYYDGFSLTHNPDLYYFVPEMASSLGEPKANLHDFFQTEMGRKTWKELERNQQVLAFFQICFGGGLPAVKEWLKANGYEIDETYDWNKSFVPLDKLARNSYFDTYGFRHLTAGAKYGALGSFLTNKLQRSMCRSRVSFINGKMWNPNAASYMWHHDEPIFFNLRINVPLQTSPNYKVEIEGHPLTHFEPGYFYSWNTEILHRVFAEKKEESSRAHLVIGTVPWFDYDAESDSYISNEFFGELHPHDMLAQGFVFKNVRLAPD